MTELQAKTIMQFVELLRANSGDMAAWQGLEHLMPDAEDKLVCLRQVIRLQAEEVKRLEADGLALIEDYDAERTRRSAVEKKLKKLEVKMSRQQEAAHDQAQDENSQHSLETIPLPDVIELFFPKIKFLRDSLKILNANKEAKAILRYFYRLYYTPKEVKAISFESADGWMEFDFGKDGRIYYLREDGNLLLLISRKQEQLRDQKYLKNYAVNH